MTKVDETVAKVVAKVGRWPKEVVTKTRRGQNT